MNPIIRKFILKILAILKCDLKLQVKDLFLKKGAEKMVFRKPFFNEQPIATNLEVT